MPELLIRAGASDAALMRRTFGIGGGAAASRRPCRIVVDAHVPLSADLATTARRAGVPFLVDPQTYFLQDAQHAGGEWTRLPYAISRPVSLGELESPLVVERLVARCVEHQLTSGATMIIAPYVHLDRTDSPWIAVQRNLWLATRRYLDREHVALDVVAVLAVGWRMLHLIRGRAALAPASRALVELCPTEIAVAATRAHQGAHAQESLHELLLLVEDIGRRWPVIMWQQGLLGEVCVAAGAIGYETGIGWRENCDLQTAMGRYRVPSTGHPGARPVYIEALRRSLPKRTVERLQHERGVWSRMICLDQECCPPAGGGLLADARQHAITSRARTLNALALPQAAHWRWAHVANDSGRSLDLARRINRAIRGWQATPEINLASMEAIHAVASQRQHRRLLRASA